MIKLQASQLQKGSVVRDIKSLNRKKKQKEKYNQERQITPGVRHLRYLNDNYSLPPGEQGSFVTCFRTQITRATILRHLWFPGKCPSLLLRKIMQREKERDRNGEQRVRDMANAQMDALKLRATCREAKHREASFPHYC